ncbi:MAG: fimbria/pilus periplasmic chaperone [Alishewanella sp.]|nr:fimbria/pilus periplasmic chaperone [Alishewanella sp.]
MKIMPVVIICLMTLMTSVGHAAELLISPVNIDIPPGEKSALLTLQNNSNKTIKIQVRVRPWDWDNEINQPRNVVVSPSSLNIQPGKQQVVRVVNVGPESTLDREQLYRVILDEIPDLEQPAEKGLVLRVRYALPLFIGGPDLSTSRINDFEKLKSIWQQFISYRYDAETRQLVFNNRATGHARISKVKLIDAEGRESAIFAGLLGYVLANSESAFAVAALPLTEEMKLYAEVNGITLEIPADGR